jgi:dihydroflavonol-4-reductase
MASVAGVRPPQFPLSPGLTRLYGQFNDWRSKLTGKPSQVTLPMAMIANDGHYFSSAKAIAELNLPQTPIRDAFQEAYDWFIEHGYIN